MNTLLLGVLLSHLGTYMIAPLLPIFLKLNKGLSVTEIGLVLAAAPFSFQGGSLLGGYLADRVGRRTVIALGAWLNAASLVGYVWFDSLWLLLGIALLSGLGVGLNAPSTKAAIASLISGGNTRTTAFSFRGIAANIGTAAAGLLTYFVLGGASALSFFTAAGLFVVLGLISWMFLPKSCGEQPCKAIPLSSYADIWNNKGFVVFSIVIVFVWALYTQLSLSVPLRASEILPDPSIVSLIWTVNSIIVIFLQTPISRWILNRIPSLFSLGFGMLFIGAGLGSLYWSTNFYSLLASGVIFIIGEMLIVPTIDSTVSVMANARMIGVFFGLTNFVSGLGEGLGKFAGAQLLSFGATSLVPWIVYGLAAILISAVLFLLRFWGPLRLPLGEERTFTAAEQNKDGDSAEEKRYLSADDRLFGRKNPAK